MNTTNNLYQSTSYYTIRYALALGLGCLIGIVYIPNIFFAVSYIALSIPLLFFSFRNDKSQFFSLLCYFVYTELFIRAQGKYIPYLLSQYILIACFLLLIFRQGTTIKLHSKVFILLILFAFVETFDTSRSNFPEYARFVCANTVLLSVVAIWGSSNVLSPRLLLLLIHNMKFASIFLCGIIMAAHLRGGIEYGLYSNFDSTNGLQPVQISAYLGFSSILFFLSIMNIEERKMLWLNIVLFTISCTLMILSFSRGGLYFLCAVMFLYFLFNLRKSGNYGIILLLIPVGFLILYYVTAATGGVIEERYAQEGTSGRDELIRAGFEIFRREPLVGIGTGSFTKEILQNNLYGIESGAHNEFIRVLAEHGLFGIFTCWMFYIVLFFQILRRKKIQRDYGIYFLVLFCLIMVHNALKITLQSIILLLVIATPSLVSRTKANVQHIVEPAN